MSEKLNIDEQIAALDEDIELQEWYVARAEALERLKKNSDFQIVLEEGLIQMEADRVYNLLIHPLTVKPEDKESYLSQLDTIKNFGRYLGTPEYLGTCIIQGQNAKIALQDTISQKQKLLAEKDV